MTAGNQSMKVRTSFEKRDAPIVLRRAETKVADGLREGPAVIEPVLRISWKDKKTTISSSGFKTWKLREQHLAHPEGRFLEACERRPSRHPNFSLRGRKRLEEGAAPGTVNRELDCLHRMMFLGQRAYAPPRSSLFPHFPRLAEEMCGRGSVSMMPTCAFRGAAPYHIQVAATIGYYTGDAKRGDSLPPVGEATSTWSSTGIRLELQGRPKLTPPRGLYMTGDFLEGDVEGEGSPRPVSIHTVHGWCI